MSALPQYPSELADRLGIFARTFRRDTVRQVAIAVADAGYTMAHWNFAAVGRDTLGRDIPEDDFAQVREVFAASGLTVPSISCTYNIAHPDAALRARNTEAATRLIGLARLTGADVVTLCSGTRDAENQWRAHPDNTTPEAWRDMRSTLDALLTAADAAGVLLGIEPEPANIVRDADAARRLLDELGDDAPIGIILDCANLLSPQTIAHQSEILHRAVELIGDRVIGAQAKDVVDSGYAGPGAGMMDYRLVLEILDGLAPVPLIVQDADEADARRVHDDILRWHAEATGGAR